MEENKEYKSELSSEVKQESKKEEIYDKQMSQKELDDNNVKQAVQNTNNTSAKKRFEVEIYDKISVGEPPYDRVQLQKVNFDKPVIIEAANKKDLQEFGEKLALCQQTFKIVRVLDDVKVQQQTQQISQQQTQNTQTTTIQQPIVKSKPKYYKIGNIEIKDDNGKIYQKQWLKLTDEEMTNFRLVSNKTNAIVPLKDKSIEMKKWILVESAEDTSTTLEENMK